MLRLFHLTSYCMYTLYYLISSQNIGVVMLKSSRCEIIENVICVAAVRGEDLTYLLYYKHGFNMEELTKMEQDVCLLLEAVC